jgi:hypothetical protein
LWLFNEIYDLRVEDKEGRLRNALAAFIGCGLGICDIAMRNFHLALAWTYFVRRRSAKPVDRQEERDFADRPERCHPGELLNTAGSLHHSGPDADTHSGHCHSVDKCCDLFSQMLKLGR